MTKKLKAESAERTEVFTHRNDAGEIINYSFKIYKKHEEPFCGEISREEMSAIKCLYTNQGVGLTQWQVYNELADSFNKYTFSQFQSIIRAFKITKADSAFADHEIEECNNNELSDRLFRIKKTAHIRKADVERQKETERLVRELQRENLKLTKQIEDFNQLSKSINLDKRVQWTPVENESSHSLIVWLSDMHIGCKIDDNSLYPNPYSLEEVELRLKMVFSKVWELCKLYGGFDRLIVCNLGDSLDGQDMQTTRRDHLLPQNMNNQEQVETFVTCMFNFMDALGDIPCKSLEYYAVGSSNHGGDFEWTAQKILQAQLNAINIKATIFTKFIDWFTVNDISFLCCHGKDSQDMKRPLPITINDKTEIFINQYIREYNVPNKKIVFVKGDSHQTATTYAKNFIYKSVGCFIGNTKWSSANFGNTPAVCEFSLITNNEIMDGIINLNLFMDIQISELLRGKPTVIKNKEYLSTAAYVEPFLERLQRLTDDFRVHVQLPDQYTKTVDGEINTDDITYNRVYVEAVMPDEDCFPEHEKVIGMVMGLDVRKPVAKFYNGSLNSACTNLCVFSPEYLSCQAVEPETALDYKPLDKLINMKEHTKEILQALKATKFTNSITEQEKHLGQWVRNVMLSTYDNGFAPVKFSVDNAIQAYKSLFMKEDSDYYQTMDEVNMFDVYNAFTKQITNGVERGRDIINSFEKTLLLRQILGF